MKGIKSYITEQELDEKVSKEMIDKVLSNNDIIIGGEWEFVAEDLDLQNNSEDRYRDFVKELSNRYYEAHSEWQSWKDSYTSFINDVSDKLDDITEEQMPTMDGPYFAYVKKYGYDSDTKERKLTFLNFTIPLNDYGKPKSPTDSSSDEQKEQYKIALYNYNTYQEELKSYDKNVRKALDSYIEDNEIDIPEEPNDYYFDFMRNELGYSKDEIIDQKDNFVPVYLEPFEPDYESYREIFDEEEVSINDELKGTPMENNYVISNDYHDVQPSIGDTDWVFEPDISIKDNRGRQAEKGIELVSPPMTISKFIKDCPKVFDWIQKIGYTNRSCGFHIHMSIEGIDLETDLNPIKLILLTDEEYIYQAFDNRRLNSYARSIKHADSDFNRIDINDIKSLLKDTDKTSNNFNRSNRYFGINFTITDENHIEFRYMGGEDYEKKWDKIKPIIANYAYNLSAACDPEFLKKEYLNRLYRLYRNIINLYTSADIVISYCIIDMLNTEEMKNGYGNGVKISTKILENFIKSKNQIIPSATNLQSSVKQFLYYYNMFHGGKDFVIDFYSILKELDNKLKPDEDIREIIFSKSFIESDVADYFFDKTGLNISRNNISHIDYNKFKK